MKLPLTIFVLLTCIPLLVHPHWSILTGNITVMPAVCIHCSFGDHQIE